MKPPLTTARAIALSYCILSLTFSSLAQTIGTFTTMAPAVQSQTLDLPSTHTFQRIIKSGDALSLGGTVGGNLDFTGYVPIAGSSRNGYLSISNETTPAGITVLGTSYNFSTHTWTVNNGGNVNFPLADIGNIARFCSGTVTPNGTIIVSEEDITAGDVNTDGYPDRGWLIEINPATRTVINQDGIGGTDKLWALGRTSRENAAVRSDNQVLYTGADDASLGYLYKFIPTVPGNFSSGTLYVLQTTAALGNGTWRLIANTTQAQRNAIRTASTSAGAYNFNGIEDVEFGPGGKIYFAAKNEGKVYRFTDNGTAGTATDISGLEVFVGNDAYPTIKNYDVDGPGGAAAEPWGRGNDNLAFDGEGNLFVCQDAIVASDRNYIWMVGSTHTQASPQVKIFARTPTRAEPTGITFTPDKKFMFLSFMSPTGTNSTAQTDAAGASVIFNTHTTVVIALKSHLGTTATLTLPVTFAGFIAKQTEPGVDLNWTVAEVSNHHYFAVERSTDGVRYEEIHRNNQLLANGSSHSFNYLDRDAPTTATTLYYRIKQCDLDDKCRYSEIRTVSVAGNNHTMSIYPVPAFDKINVRYTSTRSADVTISIVDGLGRIVLKQKRSVTSGAVIIPVGVQRLVSGNFTLTLDNGTESYKQRFSKL